MSNRTHKFVCSVLIGLAVMPASMSQGAVARTAISAQRIVDAMALAGIAARPNQIELLSRVTSATLQATMRVERVSTGTAGTLKVKFRCQDNHECLPFYVLVHDVDGMGIKIGNAGVRETPVDAASPLQNIIRGGDHATLILETPDSRMSFPVICLQGGARGQRVRVTSTDRKRLYDAEVVAAGLVKGSL